MLEVRGPDLVVEVVPRRVALELVAGVLDSRSGSSTATRAGRDEDTIATHDLPREGTHVGAVRGPRSGRGIAPGLDRSGNRDPVDVVLDRDRVFVVRAEGLDQQLHGPER